MPTQKLDDSPFPVLAGIAGPVLAVPVVVGLAAPVVSNGQWLLGLVLAGLLMAAGPLYAAVRTHRVGWAAFAAVMALSPLALVVAWFVIALSGPWG